MLDIITHSEAETKKIASELVKKQKKATFICLYGDLGSGKTVFAKGVALALGMQEKEIKSPTYTFVRSYLLKSQKGSLKLYHFDFYRVQEADDLMAKDLEEIFAQKNTWIIVEWPERIEKLLPSERIDISLEYSGATSRRITII